MNDFTRYGKFRSDVNDVRVEDAVDIGLGEHMASVYRTMSVGMLVTAVTAWLVSVLSFSSGPNGRVMTEFGQLLFGTPLKWVIIFAPLAMIFMIGPALRKLSPAGLRTAFYVMAAIFGISMSSIFIAFSGVSIATAFLATTAGFAGLSLYGYTTKKDLSGFGKFLFIGLIGLLVVMIINIFVASSAMSFAISVIGILIFAGLTAHDTQEAKNAYLSTPSGDVDTLSRAVTMSAFSLYLNFINMFQFILNLMGMSRD